MTQRQFRYIARGANDITFRDPNKVSTQLRFVNSLPVQTINGLRVQKQRNELIFNEQMPLCVKEDSCGPQAIDDLSIRIKVSGAIDHADHLEQRVLDMLHNYTAAVKAGLLRGFLPTDQSQFVLDLPGE